MASSALQSSCLCRVKQMQGLLSVRFLPQPSTTWPPKVCRAPARTFSKSSGPVRYIPRGTRQQGRGEQSLGQSQTDRPADGSSTKVEGMDRFRSARHSKKMAQRLKATEDLDDEFFRAQKMIGTCRDFLHDQEDSSEVEQVSPKAQQINGKRERFNQTGSLCSPLRMSRPNSFAALQSFASKSQKAASIEINTLDTLGFSVASAVEHAPNTTPENEDNFLTYDDTHTLDDRGNLTDGFSALENELEDMAKFSSELQLSNIQSSRLREAEAASRAAQEDAKNQAIRYLAMRQCSSFQLRKKLRSRNISPELVEYAITVVQDCGMQSDLAYAETFAHSRWNVGSWGPQRIKQALKQRGVSYDIVTIAIDRVFNEDKNDIDPSEQNSLGMSKSAIDQLLMQASKQWNRGKNVSDDTKVRRMICWLQYRGFNYKVIQRVLKFLQKKSLNTEI